MWLSRYGFREWLVLTIIAIAAIVIAGWFAPWWVAWIVFIVWLALAAFFRDPTRRVPTNLPAGTMLSPADGTVSAVERVDHHDATDGPAVIVRIFLSIFNVHINRAPCDGAIVSITHKPGKYLDARKAESAKVNESNLVTLRTSDGETIGVRQVSGAVARRIVCAIESGQHVQPGERYGMIKFGSTTELILPRPDDVTVHVKVGDTVRGGLTTLATLPPPAARES